MMKTETELNELYAVLATIKSRKKEKNAKIRFPMYITTDMMLLDVEELELSVRAYNSLKRAGLFTVGQLVEKISGSEDLARIRNCGKTSVSEIMMKLITYQYGELGPERKKQYLQRLVELNKE